jgi:hypothetical protein
LPVSLIPLVVYGIYKGLRKKIKELLLVLSFALVPILAVNEFSKTITARYIYFAIPFVFIIAAFSFLSKEDREIKFIKIIFYLFLAHALFIDMQLITNPVKVNLPRTERSGYLEEWTAGQGIKDIANYLDEESESLGQDEQIVVGTEGFFGTLPDGLQIYMNDNSKVTVIGVGQPIRNLPESLTESKKSGNDTYLVVNSTRLLTNSEDLPVELISVYPKAVQPDGERESLLFFKLKD